jgi:NitT/TauT family transport system permease protein
MSAGAALIPVRSHLAQRRSRLPRWYRRQEALILGISGFVVFLVLWELGSAAGVIEKFFFSSPTAIVAAGIREVQIPRFWDDVRVSGLELFVGCAMAVLVGVPVGLAVGWYRRIGYMFDPWLNFFNSMPRIALLPLIVLWLGLGIETKFAIVFLGGLFSIVIPTAQGVKTVDRTFLDVGRSLGASQRRIFTSIVLPSTVPFIIAGMRLGIGRGLIGVVVAEAYAQTQGVGVMIVKAQQALLTDRMLFAILLFSISSIFLALLVNYFERRVQRWRPGQDVEETGT